MCPLRFVLIIFSAIVALIALVWSSDDPYNVCALCSSLSLNLGSVIREEIRLDNCCRIRFRSLSLELLEGIQGTLLSRSAIGYRSNQTGRARKGKRGPQ